MDTSLASIFRRLAYEVAGVDVCGDDHRRGLFERAGIAFVRANLNDLDPFQNLRAQGARERLGRAARTVYRKHFTVSRIVAELRRQPD